MRIMFIFLVFQALVCHAQDDRVRVVELFTSQSCSSCPAADQLLGELANEPGVIALGLHVTYWDHLSWVDTFSLKTATERQATYPVKRDMAGVFTPEMIVNGSVSFTGSDRQRLRTELAKARELPRLKLNRDGAGLVVAIPSASDERVPAIKGELVLMTYKDSERVVIKRGENSGRAVSYTNVVRGIEKMGAFASGKAVKPALLSQEDTNGIVALVQDSKTGEVFAAGTYRYYRGIAR
jgi:hypothetical protein